MTFYICKACGNMLAYLKKGACTAKCCGQTMEEMIPNTTDAAGEKHVPVIKRDGQKIIVEVGAVAHPMLEAHFIEWIALQSKQGAQRKELKPGEAPNAKFALVDGDEVEEVYAYCNLHGLWKAE